MPDPAVNDATSLPESKVTLKSLHALCEQCLELADRARHRNEQCLRHYLDLGEGKIDFPTLQRHFQQVGEFHASDRNNYVPDAPALLQYFAPESADVLQEALNLGGHSTSFTPANPVQAEQWAASAISLITGQRLHVLLLRDLKKRIEEKLEASNQKTSADSSADIEKILAKIAPQNEAVRNLHLKLQREMGSSTSQRQIAIEFTDGDAPRADSLLRQVRRYRKKLEAALKELDS